MSQIPPEGLNHYAMVHGPNSIQLEDKVVGHWSAYRKTIEDCFSNIHAFDDRYERANGYSRPCVHTTETPIINDANP